MSNSNGSSTTTPNKHLFHPTAANVIDYGSKSSSGAMLSPNKQEQRHHSLRQQPFSVINALATAKCNRGSSGVIARRSSMSDSGSFESSSDYDASAGGDAGTPSHQTYWRSRLSNFKNSILGTPRFHRRNKLINLHGHDYNTNEHMCDTGPNMTKKSWFGQLLVLGGGGGGTLGGAGIGQTSNSCTPVHSNNSGSFSSSAWSNNGDTASSKGLHHHSVLSASPSSSHGRDQSISNMQTQAAGNNHVHVVLIKDRPLTVIKADLIHTFFSSPDVTHQILSPMSFRVEFKRPPGTSSMFQRSVKMQIDIAPASSSLNHQVSSSSPYTPMKSSQLIVTNNGHQSTSSASFDSSSSNTSGASSPGPTPAVNPSPGINSQRAGSFRSVYCLTFTLISGPYQRFKRICENMQHQLINHKVNYVLSKPQMHSDSSVSSVGQSHQQQQQQQNSATGGTPAKTPAARAFSSSINVFKVGPNSSSNSHSANITASGSSMLTDSGQLSENNGSLCKD